MFLLFLVRAARRAAGAFLMGKLFCGIGILSSLLAGEGAYRIYGLASAVADKTLPLHLFVLAASAFGVIVFCLLLAGKSNAFLNALSAAMLLFSALVLLVAPVLDIAAYGVPGMTTEFLSVSAVIRCLVGLSAGFLCMLLAATAQH